jgi:hypothetical protein
MDDRDLDRKRRCGLGREFVHSYLVEERRFHAEHVTPSRVFVAIPNT